MDAAPYPIPALAHPAPSTPTPALPPPPPCPHPCTLCPMPLHVSPLGVTGDDTVSGSGPEQPLPGFPWLPGHPPRVMAARLTRRAGHRSPTLSGDSQGLHRHGHTRRPTSRTPALRPPSSARSHPVPTGSGGSAHPGSRRPRCSRVCTKSSCSPGLGVALILTHAALPRKSWDLGRLMARIDMPGPGAHVPGHVIT